MFVVIYTGRDINIMNFKIDCFHQNFVFYYIILLFHCCCSGDILIIISVPLKQSKQLAPDF